jgi:hypothetical protein
MTMFDKRQFGVSIDVCLFNRLLEYGTEHHCHTISEMLEQLIDQHTKAINSRRRWEEARTKKAASAATDTAS